MTEIGTGPAPVTAEEFAALVNTECRKSVGGIIGAGSVEIGREPAASDGASRLHDSGGWRILRV